MMWMDGHIDAEEGVDYFEYEFESKEHQRRFLNWCKRINYMVWMNKKTKEIGYDFSESYQPDWDEDEFVFRSLIEYTVDFPTYHVMCRRWDNVGGSKAAQKAFSAEWRLVDKTIFRFFKENPDVPEKRTLRDNGSDRDLDNEDDAIPYWSMWDEDGSERFHEKGNHCELLQNEPCGNKLSFTFTDADQHRDFMNWAAEKAVFTRWKHKTSGEITTEFHPDRAFSKEDSWRLLMTDLEAYGKDDVGYVVITYIYSAKDDLFDVVEAAKKELFDKLDSYFVEHPEVTKNLTVI